MEAALEEAETAVALSQRLEQAGNVVGEARDLAHERRDQEVAERRDGDQRKRERDRDGLPTREPASLERLDGRLERHREHDGDEQLEKDRARSVGEGDQEDPSEREEDERHERAGRDDHLRDLRLGPGLGSVGERRPHREHATTVATFTSMRSVWRRTARPSGWASCWPTTG